MVRHLTRFLIVLILLAFVVDAEAAKVFKRKGKSVLIVLSKKEAKSVSKGDVLYVVRGKKRKGSILIKKIKGRKGIGRLTKGSAKKGDRLVSASKAVKSVAKNIDAAAGDSEIQEPSKLDLGALVGYGLSSQTIEIEGQGSLKQTGSGIGFKAFGDFKLLNKIGVRGQAGLESFNVEGEIDEGGSTSTVATEIGYFSLDVLIRYRVLDGGFKVWVAGGLGILVPMSQASDTLDEGSISSTSTFIGQLGVSVKLGEKLFLPIQAEYVYFPPSEQVTSSMLAVRTGLGYQF